MNREAESYYYDIWRGAAKRAEKAEADNARLEQRITQLEEWLVESFDNNDTERFAKEKAEAERDRLREALNKIEFLATSITQNRLPKTDPMHALRSIGDIASLALSKGKTWGSEQESHSKGD